MEVDGHQWFSYPSHTAGKKTGRKVLPEEDRKEIYEEDKEEQQREEKEYNIQDIKKQISDTKYFMENLNWINMIQSLHELKLYVTYLLDKDQEYDFAITLYSKSYFITY